MQPKASGDGCCSTGPLSPAQHPYSAAINHALVGCIEGWLHCRLGLCVQMWRGSACPHHRATCKMSVRRRTDYALDRFPPYRMHDQLESMQEVIEQVCISGKVGHSSRRVATQVPDVAGSADPNETVQRRSSHQAKIALLSLSTEDAGQNVPMYLNRSHSRTLLLLLISDVLLNETFHTSVTSISSWVPSYAPATNDDRHHRLLTILLRMHPALDNCASFWSQLASPVKRL